MRLRILVTAILTFLAPTSINAAEPEKTAIELRSDLIDAGLPLAESEKPIYNIRLTAQVDKKGEGSGTLELDPNAPSFDEFGFLKAPGDSPLLKLECSLKHVKTVKLKLPDSPRIAAPLVEVDWVLYEIKGPKITSRLFLATEEKSLSSFGRLLVHDKDGKVRHAIGLTTPPPPPPCHPGCFPAGTTVRVPDGTKPIERIREGDAVTTLDADGKASIDKVTGVFVTRNRLLEVRVEGGKLVTTETQPIALENGGFRPASELKAGDRVWRWVDGKQRAVAVLEVGRADREVEVFNLVLGEPKGFIAGGFVVRSKPRTVEPRSGVKAP